jgi:hypothetical protein
MRERAEAAVAQQHVAGAELGMELRHSGHVVGEQPVGQDFQGT